MDDVRELEESVFGGENRKWWTLVAVSLGLFMIMLDNTVVNVALPSIQHDLGLSLSELEWVVGEGWSIDSFAGGTPDRADLDAILPDRPAYLVNRDGHGAWVNGRALERAGVTGETPDPSGGRIERRADGEPQGTLHEEAMHLVADLLPPTTPEEWEEGIRRATISLAIVDDATIRPLNARYLGHDYATDVLSFVLEQSDEELDGEIIVSAETAASSAARFGWQAADELLLYVIHGALHLVGCDDLEPALQTRMRQREREHLAHFGLTPRYEE